MFGRMIALCKGLSYEEYLAAEIARLKSKVDKRIDYDPNILTFIRDSVGFGHFKLGLIFYGINVVIIMAIIGTYLLGHISSDEMYGTIKGVLVWLVILGPIGIFLRIKFPV